MKKNKKSILYIRVSTEEQSNEGHSLENQKNRLLEYCKNNSIENHHIYEDAGYSATNTKRPYYQKMLHEIRNKKIDKIIFLKIDRISRNTEDYLTLIDLCIKNNIKLISLNENIDMNANGKFLQVLFSGLAQMERQQISERTKDGYVGCFEKGLYAFSSVCLPFGFTKKR